MRTVRNSSRLMGGCMVPGGLFALGGLLQGGVPGPGGAWSLDWGGGACNKGVGMVSLHADRHTLPVDRQTGVKT